MKSTVGGQWRISGRSRGPRIALARTAAGLVLAMASVAALGAGSLASAAGAPQHHAAVASRHHVAGAPRHHAAHASRHHAAHALRHHAAHASRHDAAHASRHHAAHALRHDGAGAPLSCDGGTIYSYQRGTSHSDPATTGSVYALNTGTVGGSTVAATLVTKVPSGGFANALGIAKGGTAMYAVNQTTSKANSAVIHGYSASTRTWTRYTGNSSGASGSFVAGAVNPATGVYYYVTYGTGSASRPGTGTVYGFDTNTKTRITGVIATFGLPTGKSSAPNNGDIAFDSAGNMYVLASNGSTVGVGVVKGPIPTTGSSSGASLTDTLLNRFADSNSYNGIAFDNSGNLYGSGIRGTTSVLNKLNPNNGAVIAGPTPLSSDAQAFANVDLAACSLNPTLSLGKDIVARYAPDDQFTLSITGGGIRSGNTTTTTGHTTGVQPEVAGPVIAGTGMTYTLDETAASGSLLNYATTYACVDTANGDAPVASGTGASITLPFPATTVVSPNVVCTFTNAPLRPGITLQKSVAEDTLTVGETLHYSFLVTNTGNVTLALVTLNDTEFTGHGTRPVVTCPGVEPALARAASVAALAPGASVTCTATYTVTQADVDAGSVRNAATASGQTPASQTITSTPSSAVVHGVRSPAITVVKSASPTSFSAAGKTIHYRFDVTNSGNVTLNHVKVHDTDLPGLSAITCPHHTLAAGASQTCTATYLTTAADLDAGSVTNHATAHGDPPTGPPVTSPPSSATITAIQSPAITVVKSASPRSFSAAGQTIHYRFDVTNSGNVTLNHVKVHDTDLPGLSAITCPHHTLAAGASQTCTATYLTTAADLDAGSVTNHATASGKPPAGPPVKSGPSSATITAIHAPAITVVKSASPTSFSAAGQTIHYRFDVTNSGNVTLSHVKVHDTDLPGLSAITCPHHTLAAGASQTCTATYTTTAADVDAGSVTNRATAWGKPPAGPPVKSAPSSATITLILSPQVPVTG